MGFRQLYYTSSETGLSGYPGFQFNAVTSGVSPETMRHVEALTAYDPPSSLPYNADAATIRSCPVNLCFASVAGAYGVLAQVTFVGTDYSNRFGNYFAHALTHHDPAAALGGLLPIELWRAKFWSTTAVTDTELPELADPLPPGELSRSSVAAFLNGRSDSDLLPRLLTSAARVVAGERTTVVLVERDSDAAAHWIGAVSFLLPAGLAQRMSFATYLHRPAYTDLDVVATVPDADVDRGDAGFASFLQFDFVAGRTSDVVAEPWSELVCEVGVEGAAQLWESANALDGGLGQEPSEWFPLLAAAGFDRGTDLGATTGSAARAAAVWLAARAKELDPALVTRIGSSVLRSRLAQPSSPATTLGDLARAARAAGATALLVSVENAATDRAVDAVLAGSSEPSTGGVAVRSAQGRAFAADRVGKAITGVPPATALRLLAWAARSQLALDPSLLRKLGVRVVGPRAMDQPEDTAQYLIPEWPTLREGVVAVLAEAVADQPDRVVEVLAGTLGDALDDRELSRVPGLFEAAEIAGSRRHPERRAAALGKIIERRSLAGRSPAVGADLLRQIWPDGRWLPGEASRLLDTLDDRTAVSEAPLAWFEAVFTADGSPEDATYFQDLERLARDVEHSSVAKKLSAAARKKITRLLAVDRALTTGSGPVNQVAVLTAGLDRLSSQESQHTLGKVRKLIDGVAARDLPNVLAACPEPVLADYLLATRPYLEKDRARPDIASRLYYALAVLRRSRSSDAKATANALDHELLDRLANWDRTPLKNVESALRALDGKVANDFAVWRDLNASGWLRRVLAKQQIKKRRQAPLKAARKAEKRRRKEEAAKKAKAAKKVEDAKKATAAKADQRRSASDRRGKR